MVLCESDLLPNSLAGLWLLFAMSGAALVLVLAVPLFIVYYVNPTYEQWKWKTNPRYPSPDMIKLEVTKSLKGAFLATMAPALSTYWARTNSSYTKGYCGIDEEPDMLYTIKMFLFTWIIADFYEFFYHWLGHTFDSLWEQHKSHHRFYNPTPFATIADDVVDQIFRSAPLLVIPILFTVNIDILFAQWGTLFYVYGTYLHWGYESQFLSAHNKVLNTAYDHHCHHAKSIKNKAIRTGFFLKIWDDLFRSVYNEACFCVRCQHKEGKRTLEEFKKIKIPDYSVLIKPSFWLQSPDEKSP
mmetsp:Transcript_581/g.577  ORF Transcript_581/g.577 Transcript_581/m.577 type:complete len:299 (-) Transcript_581:318-1214(-)